MATAVAALAANGPTSVYGADVTADSFPGFEYTLQALGADISVEGTRAAEALHV
jgi:3-phosphoshikimate 1-carboxyvinyltransferase